MIIQNVRSKFFLIGIATIFFLTVVYCCKKEEVKEEARFFSPSSLNAKVFNDSSIVLNWKDNSNIEAHFQIHRKANSDAFKQIAELSANDTLYHDSNVNPNITYTYRVRAVSSSAETNFSEEVSLKLDLPVPVLNSIMISDAAIKLFWTDNSSLETSFILERSEGNESFIKLAEVGRNVLNYTDSALEINQGYTYRIKAKNKLTETTYSNTINALISFDAPVLTVNIQNANMASLSWSDNSKYEKGFIIEQSVNDGNFMLLAKTDSQTVNYKVENLQIASKYAFRVKAYSLKNNSGYSSIKKIYFNDKRYVEKESYNSEVTAEGQVAFSSSTNLIATSNYFTPHVKVYDRTNPSRNTTLVSHSGGGYTVRFSPDNVYLLTTGAKDGFIKIWNASSNTIIKTISTGMGAIYSLTFNKSGTLLAVGGTGASQIYVYSFPSMTLRHVFNSDNANVRDLLFFENDTKLISCGNDDKIHFWDMSSLLKEKTLSGHTGHIGVMALSSDQSLLVSGSYEDQTIKVWNPKSSLIRTIFNPFNITGVFFDSKNNIYYTDQGGYFKIVDMFGNKLFEIKTNNSINYSCFDENSKQAVVYGEDGQIKVLKCEPIWMEY